LEDGLGDIARMIRVDYRLQYRRRSIWTRTYRILKRSGAEIFVFAGVPANAAKVIRKAADLNWHPLFITNSMASSIAMALKPAGLENALGVITAAFLKDANDPAWKGEQATNDWQAFVGKYNRAGGKDEQCRRLRLRGRRTLPRY